MPHDRSVDSAEFGSTELQRDMNEMCLEIAGTRAKLELARRHGDEYKQLLEKELEAFK